MSKTTSRIMFPSLKRKLFLILTIVFLLYLFLPFYNNIQNCSHIHTIAKSYNTIEDFISADVKYKNLYTFKKNNQDFIWWHVGIKKNDIFVSGSPVFIFDNKGKLIDYTCDFGDDGRFQSMWPNFNQLRIISIKEVLKITNEVIP